MTATPHELKGLKSRSSVLVRGFSALEIAKQAGLVPQYFNEAQYTQWIIDQARGEPGSTTVSYSIDAEGLMSPTRVFHEFLADEDMTIDLVKSIGFAKVPATSLKTLGIWRDDVQVGTIDFFAGQAAPTISSSVSVWSRGQRLTVTPPASLDATLADVLITLSFQRSK